MCALLISRMLGDDLFFAVMFGTIGFFISHAVLRIRINLAPYPLFLLLMLLGLAGEIITALNFACVNQDNFYVAWLFFVPTLFFLLFSSGIRGAMRKIWGIGYAVFLMLMHLHAAPEIGKAASLSFLPMQLALLYVSIFSLKQKNGAS